MAGAASRALGAIAFRNGVMWEFDVPKVGKKGAETVVRTLGGTID